MTTPAFSPRLQEGSCLHSQSRTTRSSQTRSKHSSSISQALPSTRPIEPRTPAPVSLDPRTPSPNYFGLTVDSSGDCFSSAAGQHARANWSPPTSNVRSTAAISPKIIPVDQNPEFEAFKRQSENTSRLNFGRLSDFGLANPSQGFAMFRASDSSNSLETSSPSTTAPQSPPRPPALSGNPLSPTLGKPRSPKRLLSSDSSVFPEQPRRDSPASFAITERPSSTEVASFLPHGSLARISLPNSGSASRYDSSHRRAETVPTSSPSGSLEPEPPVIITPQYVINLMESAEDEILLLDIRVSTQYSRSRITGALNLCIPSTLLKRPAFNVLKLAETFQDDEQRNKFERWRNSKYIIVYDATSATIKDATACLNMLKKFTSEGWKGCSYIIRGGFTEFSTKFPSYIEVDRSRKPGSQSNDADSDGPAVAPVAGGCPMPATRNAANPFFGNIRQNMDLISGVGQIAVKQPDYLTNSQRQHMPRWLRNTTEVSDQGKQISNKFLNIERREKKRMEEALSGHVTYGTPGAEAQHSIRIAGIEKGHKNRYNSIWPYEHSRVKLLNVSNEDCDYFNANYAKAEQSSKRYIATQSPLPGTFNDFWKVVWQQDVRVIVMLTAETENGLIKAHNYWSGRRYGSFQLTFLSEHRASIEPSKIHRRKAKTGSELHSPVLHHNADKRSDFISKDPAPLRSDEPYVVVRKFTLANLEQPFERMREVTQMQYSSWPDFGAPALPAHLLGLIEQCDAVVRSTQPTSDSESSLHTRPVLVHCSAGCGRTGTFCTVDSVIDILKHQRISDDNGYFSKDLESQSSTANSNDSTPNSDLIEKTVEGFRSQRLSMVQSLRQYVLCYESILEWLAERDQGSS